MQQVIVEMDAIKVINSGETPKVLGNVDVNT